MQSRIEEGLQKGLIKFANADRSQIVYINYDKPRNYNNPEEQVQAEAFLRLVLESGYKPERIKQYVKVTQGSSVKEADIIVYNDDECLQPHILVECKKQDVSEQEFQQAIEQAYSYAYALPNDVKYVWVTSWLKNEYFEVDKKLNTRKQEPDIPQFGVKELAPYRFVYDADKLPITEGKQRFADLAIIEQSDLTRSFKLAHDALWAGGQLNPSEAFDELDKLIFCKIWDERKYRKIGEPYDFQIITISKNEEPDPIKRRQKENESLYKRILALYEEGRKKDAEVFRDNIRLSPEKIRTVVGYLESINLGETDLDSKGRAFETFMDSFFRGNFGQYFTPRPIVKFATDILPIKNTSYVLDSSCGSGGFLLYALNKVREQATALYPNYKTDPKQYARWHKYWHDFAENNLYGIEINEQISRAAKMNMIIHDDGHTNVITSDGLISDKEIERITTNRGFKYNHFDFIITNPPFGSTIRLSEKAYMKTYRFGLKDQDWLAVKPAKSERENQSTEILFIEQAYRFLKDEGFLAIVIPDGILTNSSLQYVRNGIEEMFRIVAVVSMPQTAFTATGAGVKSSVLVLRKWGERDSANITATKQSIESEILKKTNYLVKVNALTREKTSKLKMLSKSLNEAELKIEKAEINNWYNEEITSLKEMLQEKYDIAKRERLPDYPIFMAIAEDIGYDATGKPTAANELDYIAQELSKFILSL
ncbi:MULTISPECIES: N-6 DNA methylase [unclassified Bacteroides]|uniref:restriction endonuclease subunit M n=1 Tax=unclassified Bacteroides TaxID=2646097 RepID=UPI0013E9A947|nr:MULTISPECIES: N-6 DNA methylase [unclassified Bacteroides]QTO27125.1 restriction endonuclease subunit M [Bacteroides sp. ZJ-18]